MPKPEASVIVPVRDDARGLARLLASLEAQTLPRERFEVVVVANGCRDDSAAIGRELGAHVLEDPTPNRARARNLGATAASSDLLAFTDADCVATPGWLAALSRCAADAPLVAGRVTVTTSSSPSALERFESRWRFDQEAWVAQGWAATANLGVHRRAFDAVGGFDPSYRHAGEDPDLCLRAGRAGFGLAYCDAAEVTHPAETQAWPMLRRSFRHGHGSAQALRRLGVGQIAWRHPRALVKGDTALAAYGLDGLPLAPAELARMRRLARASYAMRVAGSVWQELRR